MCTKTIKKQRRGGANLGGCGPPANLPRGGSREPPTESGRPPAESLSRFGPSRPFVCREQRWTTHGSSQDGWKLAEADGAGTPPGRFGPGRTDRRAYAWAGSPTGRSTAPAPGHLRGGELGEDRRAEIGTGRGGECPRASARRDPHRTRSLRRQPPSGRAGGRRSRWASSRSGPTRGGEKGPGSNPAREVGGPVVAKAC
jgi:hypothetical protein